MTDSLIVAENCVVGIHYTLKDDKGNIIDSSENKDPLLYLHGHQNIVIGLEKELTGKSVGDKLSVKVNPAEGYGERDERLTQVVPLSGFAGIPEDQLKPGAQFHAEGPDGHPIVVTIAQINGDDVTIDGNHMLAGVNLNFDVEITEVRKATDEELSHGHVHSGSCGH
jgi:FKBP-type peptidyl-prolyl cis-trans isomerase SlyD